MHRLTSTCRAGLLATYPRRLSPVLPATVLEESGGTEVATPFPWPTEGRRTWPRRAALRLQPSLPASLLAEAGGSGGFPWPPLWRPGRRKPVVTVRRMPTLVWDSPAPPAVLFGRGARRPPGRCAFARRTTPRLLWPPPCYDPADCATVIRSGAAAAALRHNSSPTSAGATATMARAGASAAAFFRKRKC